MKMSKKLKGALIFLCLAVIGLFTYHIHAIMRIDVPETVRRESMQESVDGERESEGVIRELERANEHDSLPFMEIAEYPAHETDFDHEQENVELHPIHSEPSPSPLSPELLPRIVQLREQYDNPDIVGFLEITGTNISYPVAQTTDNEFYLYHDLHGDICRSREGSIFLDYENNLSELSDDNFIIYGHNMRNGNKFHNIRYFHSEDFFRTHTYILLDALYRETVWDIFSFFHTTTDFCYLTTNFSSENEFYEFILELQGRSHYLTDIVLSQDDQILILSTCGIAGGNNRYVVVARLRN